MSSSRHSSGSDVQDVRLDGLTITDPFTPEAGHAGPSNIFGGHGVRPTLTPRRGSHDPEYDGRAEFYASRPMDRLPATPRSRHSGRSMGGYDPQSEYPSSACIFIANLPQAVDDARLLNEVREVFGQFGPVHLKLRRDGRDMPYVFAQYTCDRNALVALREGRGRLISDRPCRTEPAKAGQVSYYITRRDGQDMTEAEAHDALRNLGRIASIEFLDMQIRQYLNLPGESLLVRFQNWNHERDVIGAFRCDDQYRAEIFNDGGKATPRPPATRRTPRHSERDERTVWISNLGPDITAQELLHMVAHLGRQVHYVIKPVRLTDKDGDHINRAYAFVEFENLEQVNNVIANLNDTVGSDGQILRVERKRRPAWQQGSESSLRRRYRQHEDSNTPTKTEPSQESRYRSGPLQHDSPVRARPTDRPSPATSAATLLTGQIPVPGPTFPAMAPMAPPGYHLPMTVSHPGMPMPYPMYGMPAPYQPVFQTPAPYDPMNAFAAFTAPGYMMGGFPPSEQSQGRTVQSEPNGAQDSDKDDE